MPVFKAYFKVIRKNLPSLMIYFILFVLISIMLFSTAGSQATDAFNATKSKIAFISEEQDSPIVDGLKTYLTENTQIVDVSDTQESLQDALFYGEIHYILKVPQGFAADFLSGSDDITLEKITAPMSTNSISVDMLVNKYLNLVRLYDKNLTDMSEQDIVSNVLKDLTSAVKVDLVSSSEHQKTAGLSDYFRYQAYPIIAILLMGITSIMIAFNDPEVSKRNQCAPVRPFKMSLYLFTGNAIFALAVWLVLCILALTLYGNMSLSMSVILLCLNALVFTIVSLSIGFLAGKFIKSPIAQAAMTNVVSLGVCFLSGVFMDQSWLGDTVLKIASFTPGFWYVKAVNTIRDLSVFNLDSLKPVINDMLIQLAFAAACIIIALVASKQKRQNMER